MVDRIFYPESFVKMVHHLKKSISTEFIRLNYFKYLPSNMEKYFKGSGLSAPMCPKFGCNFNINQCLSSKYNVNSVWTTNKSGLDTKAVISSVLISCSHFGCFCRKLSKFNRSHWKADFFTECTPYSQAAS